MSPGTLRTSAAVAGLSAAAVVLAHLALVWGGAAGFAARRHIAFDHGLALAVVLAGMLWAGRFTSWLETGRGRPVGDAVAIAGSIGVLAHLAWVWRDGMSNAAAVTAGHLLALALVAGAALCGSLVDRRLSSASNGLNGASISQP